MKKWTAIKALFFFSTLISAFVIGLVIGRDLLPVGTRLCVATPAQDEGVIGIRFLFHDYQPTFLVRQLYWPPYLEGFNLVDDEDILGYFVQIDPDNVYSNINQVRDKFGYFIVSALGRTEDYSSSRVEFLIHSKEDKWYSATIPSFC